MTAAFRRREHVGQRTRSASETIAAIVCLEGIQNMKCIFCYLRTLAVTRGTTCLNSLPKDKILNWSKLEAFADDKINVSEKLKYVLGRIENIVGKGENAGYQHFLLFPQCFQKTSSTGSTKVVIVW